MPSAKRRLDQLLSSLGLVARSQVAAAIRAGEVSVEGEAKLRPDLKVDPAKVQWQGKALEHTEGLLIMLHKPLGVVCSHDESEGPNVYQLLPAAWRARHPAVESVGRLDKETSGLLLLTDQHQLLHRLISPRQHVAKTYVLETDLPIPSSLVALFASGDLLLKGEGKACLPAQLTILEERKATLVLHEGKYHQVRRMFSSQGLEVLALHRRSFGALELGDLPVGAYRTLPLDFRF